MPNTLAMPEQIKYDPMVEFWKMAIPFIFKQGVAVVICLLMSYVLWQKLEKAELQHQKDRNEIWAQCSASISRLEQSWQECERAKDEMRAQINNQEGQLNLLKSTFQNFRRSQR